MPLVARLLGGGFSGASLWMGWTWTRGGRVRAFSVAGLFCAPAVAVARGVGPVAAGGSCSFVPRILHSCSRGRLVYPGRGYQQLLAPVLPR